MIFPLLMFETVSLCSPCWPSTYFVEQVAFFGHLHTLLKYDFFNAYAHAHMQEGQKRTLDALELQSQVVDLVGCIVASNSALVL